MKKTIMSLILLLVAVYAFAQAPDWQWATKAGGTSPDFGNSISLDEAGNSYVTGTFSSTVIFGNTSLTSSGVCDIFVAKMDASGNWQWATKVGGGSYDFGNSISLDEEGNYYVTGSFEDTATFGTTSLTSSGAYDIFVAKMDAAGNWQWATKAGGASHDGGNSISLDEAGNSYVTGYFRDAATFGTTSLTSSGEADIFVAKMDADGNWQWATKAGGSSDDYGNSIALDEAGNSYITGYFSDTATFGTTSLTSSGESDIFVAKMDADGNWQWTTKAGGTDYDYGNSISLDRAGNSYVTGNFSVTATFGPISLTSSGSSDIFVAKMDAGGNWQWATKAGGTDYDLGYSITLDEVENSYVTGSFYDAATFGTTSLTSSGAYDIFVAKMDSAGNWQWATKAGGTGYDEAYSIAIDDEGNSYVTGYFKHTATFGTTSLTSSGVCDIFVAKLRGDFADYPAGQATDVGGGTTITPTADLNDAAEQTIPPVPNESFTAGYENVFTGSGIVDITFNTPYGFGAYYQNGSWNSVANSGGVILFQSINFDAKGDVPIVLGDENPLSVTLSPFINVTVLKSAYPNPFNPTTTISFDIKEGETGILTIFNVKGQKIVSENFVAGSHEFKWIADNNASGVYFYELQTPTYQKISKMLMLK